MYIQYRNLTIRNAVAVDCEQLARWWNDGRVMAHAGFPNGLGTTPERIARELEEDDDVTHRRLVIEYEGRAIGEMSYRRKDGGAAEIGVKICDFSMQERGLGKILLSMLIVRLFEMGFERIVLDTNLHNTRAQHVYEQLGFRKVRVNRDSWVDQLGQSQSSVDYELRPGQLNSFL